MNLPNAITLVRLILCVVFVVVVSLATSTQSMYNWIALIVFVLAAISDYLDGYLARKLNKVTSLGKLLDPLADKILTCIGFIYITWVSVSNPDVTLCPFWVTCVIISREFLVTGLRQLAVEQGNVIAADKLGKWKTTFQLAFQIGVLTQLALGSHLSDNTSLTKVFTLIVDPDHYVIPACLWISFLLTVWSGYNYVWSNRKLFS